MPRYAHEHTINVGLSEVLEELGHSWQVRAEEAGGVFADGGRPDVLVEKPGEWPVVIEAEVDNHHGAETDARSRIGKELAQGGLPVDLALAVVYPSALRQRSGEDLRQAIRDSALEFVVLARDQENGTSRYPPIGWLSGGIRELALLLHLVAVPSSKVNALADLLERGVANAEGILTTSHPLGSHVGAGIAKVLGQHDDRDGQTRKMAMTVVIDALIFHASLAEKAVLVKDPASGAARPVVPPWNLRAGGEFVPTKVIDEWTAILGFNYWAIFHAAGSILRELPTRTAADVLRALWDVAELMIVGGVTRSHDLTGGVFQRLIADRKFLATFYTRPAAASLLAALALPLHCGLRGTSWGDADSLARLRIGDLACGTGTLLSTTYKRIGVLHELHGGNPKRLHPGFMRNGLVGMDVLNIAVHLTAAMLAGEHPDTPFEGECLLTLPYGPCDWGVAVGSLNLLTRQLPFEFMEAAARTAGGRGEEVVRDLIDRVAHGQFDLMIMNPPFSRHGSREGERRGMYNPAFAAFDADKQQQQAMSEALKALASGGCAHGHAGMASYFVELAHRKLAESGRMALVLPLTAMAGDSWEGVRRLWRESYSDVLIVSIAQGGSHTRSFSADTGMAECLVVATKCSPAEGENRGIFCVLNDQPDTALSGALLGQAISNAVADGDVRRLEDGPFGGSALRLGGTSVGEMISCPLATNGPWGTVGIRSLDLAQTAYQLAGGRLWIEGMDEGEVAQIPVSTIGAVCIRVGPHDLDITGATAKSDGLPQGPFDLHEGMQAGAAYPCLWGHDASRQRSLCVQPDSHCRIRSVRGGVPDALRKRAVTRWESSARTHYNRDLQFNSQSLIVAMTQRRSLGGRGWPTVVLKREEHEFTFCLWCNSTLGLLCHWWAATKTQAGRGSTTVSRIPGIPTLDLHALTTVRHRAAKDAFTDLSDRRFLPFDQIDEDEARCELDRRLIVDVLGLDERLCDPDGPIDRLRRKLAVEPQIHGDKNTRLVFTSDGEESIDREAI